MNINKKEEINLQSQKITIIGIGESGRGAALLSKQLGANVFISDKNVNSRNMRSKDKLIELGIDVELGRHTNRIYDSELWIISPGVPQNSEIVINALNKGIKIISEIEFASWFTNKPIIGLTGLPVSSTDPCLINFTFPVSGSISTSAI